MTRARRACGSIAGVLGLVVLATASASGATQPGLTAAAHLSPIYDAIFDARFERADSELAKACPPAPAEVCRVLEAVSLWWQIQLDPLDESRDAEFERRVEAAIAAAQAWTEREPNRAEAWFYLGGAYGARVQWRVLRGERLAAARDGKRIKDSLERALELDPDLHDAWFGIGLYHYYADVAPAALRLLRWMLFLPGGDREQGLEEMLRARSQGTLVRSEADYQLHVLYLWYENNTPRALELLEDLHRRHPTNPLFLQLIAEVQDTYQHDLTASLRTWRTLFDAAGQRQVERPELAETRARLGMALQLDRLFETDAAIEHLRAVAAARPKAPFGAFAQAQVQLGQALDRMGSREEATVAYRAALAAVPVRDPLEIAEAARAGLRERPDPAAARAYRLSIEGWRALQRGELEAADEALSQSLAIAPRDQVTRYRQARLLVAREQNDEALALLDDIAGARQATPPTIYAQACVDGARLHEEAGDRERAIELYRIATGVFGADRQTKDVAQRAIARLTRPSERQRMRE